MTNAPQTHGAGEARAENLLTLDQIREPVKDDLKAFQQHFRRHLNTEVFLLNRIINYLMRMKGKEMRPLLVLLSARLFGESTERTYTAATMIELLHTATLIHDDVVDNADERRGFLSLNHVWKNKASVLLGDFLLAKGLLVALDASEFELLKVLSEAVKRMSEGELRQLKASKLQNMNEQKYYEIISDKTGSLLVACCECGALSSGASMEQREIMRRIGHHIGLAFQIRDDLLDYSDRKTGKTTGNDIRERKITLPFIAALEEAGFAEKSKMRWLYRKKGKTTADVELIRQFVHRHEGHRYAISVMEKEAGAALDLLAQFPSTLITDRFGAFIRYVIYRKK